MILFSNIRKLGEIREKNKRDRERKRREGERKEREREREVRAGKLFECNDIVKGRGEEEDVLRGFFRASIYSLRATVCGRRYMCYAHSILEGSQLTPYPPWGIYIYSIAQEHALGWYICSWYTII